LQERLEALVYMVLSFRRNVDLPAEELARYPRAVQERFLAAVQYISPQTQELAYNFCMFALPAVDLLDEDEWDDWVQHVLGVYDQGGVLGAIVAMQKVGEYASERRSVRAGVVPLEDISGMLGRFITGLGGRSLKLAGGDEHYTDTETLFLPAGIGRFADPVDNRSLYKALAVHLWAQTWFGTWRVALGERMARFERPDHALRLFHALETLRLDSCIHRELPGLAREMARLRDLDGRGAPAGPWREAMAELDAPAASVEDSLRWLERLYPDAEPPAPLCYQGRLFPERTEPVIAQRRERDRQRFGELLAHLVQEEGQQERNLRPDEPEWSLQRRASADRPEGFELELRLHGEPVAPLEDMQQVMDSIVQDLGDIPNDYMVAAGHGAYRAGAGGTAQAPAAAGEADLAYDEWDHVRRQYRKAWCLLRQGDVHPVHDDFVRRTRDKYRGLLKHLYRTFEALRGEDKRLKKQADGDQVDIDAVVEAHADTCAGLESGERVFSERRRVDRDIAVMFLVDMSGSTKGWINDLEREALVLLCESLEILGDRYAIYGFSGFTHKRCELMRVKRLDEPYGDEVRARIGGIRPRDYTRLGVFIRHMTREFQDVEARTKLLVTLSDGRPDDQDGYRGEYGIEDTRQALMEARYQGVHPYCITIDDEAMDYLPHMYGPASFTVISELEKLPYRVSDIYRRITR
jgi:nitric oxide reductase NorD protein